MELISDYYRKQNELLHESGKKYGHRGHIHIPEIEKIMQGYGCKDVLDYGCGMATLSKHADFPVFNYDPAIKAYSGDPPKCDLVVSTDVLEHIEPELLENVLLHIKEKMKKAGYFVINTRPDVSKTLPDGTNPHKIIKSCDWWFGVLTRYFTIKKTKYDGKNFYAEVCK